ncbi:hypothetical protein V5G28_010175, partial [Scytonema sp. PRP1]
IYLFAFVAKSSDCYYYCLDNFFENLSIFNLLGLALILAGIALAISNQKAIKTKVISNNDS